MSTNNPFSPWWYYEMGRKRQAFKQQVQYWGFCGYLGLPYHRFNTAWYIHRNLRVVFCLANQLSPSLTRNTGSPYSHPETPHPCYNILMKVLFAAFGGFTNSSKALLDLIVCPPEDKLCLKTVSKPPPSSSVIGGSSNNYATSSSSS